MTLTQQQLTSVIENLARDEKIDKQAALCEVLDELRCAAEGMGLDLDKALKGEPTNCLAGMKCPQCRQFEEFDITARDNTGLRTLRVTDDGCDADGDFEYGDDAPCFCPKCGWAGFVDDARP